MKRCAHGQRNHPLRAERLRALTRARNSRRVPRNHDLSRGIEIRGRHHLISGRFRARARDRLGIEAENRGHCALADGHRLLHVSPTALHRPQGIREG